MKIKVCGITSIDQMQMLQDLGVDYIGLIFYEASKRYAGEKLNNEQLAVQHTHVDKVGVFVNAEYEKVVEAIHTYSLSVVQLHGDETDEYCLELMDKVQVIKVFRIADQTAIDELVAPYNEVCHYYLFDTDTKMYGGSGKQFDWRVLERAAINKPFFLSGGIGLEDIEKIIAFNHPSFYGVDVNSRFETSPGIKDMEMVASFVKQIKNK
jgi:phosphoribosylanthranilate isomerase